MLETNALIVLLLMIGVPTLLGLVIAVANRPRRGYWKHRGHYWERRY
jgi:hypothetical protein